MSLVNRFSRAVVVLVTAIACGDETATQPTSVATVSLDTPETLLSLREPRLLIASFLDASGRFVDGVSPAWTSSDDEIVSVDQQGNLFGVSLGGPVTITVTAGGKTAATQITVVPGSIAISPGTATLELGTTRQLTGTPLDFEGAPIAGVGGVSWTSTNSAAATVGASSGLVTTVAAGSTVIVATAAGRSSVLRLETGVPTPVDGHWLGLATSTQFTSNSRAITFDVVFGSVRTFRLTYATAGDNFCGLSLTAASGSTASVANNEFQIALDPPSRTGATSGVVSGAFASNSTMTGTYTALNFGGYSCPIPSGGMAVVGGTFGPGTVTATKQ